MSQDKNPYHSFKKVGNLEKLFPTYPKGEGNPLSKEWDEPTYLTFRLFFQSVGEDNKVDQTDYDHIPQPLFSYRDEELLTRNNYSTLSYLKDMDENVRANMLYEFIQKWNVLQTQYQWYFQSVDGIADLLKVSPGRGRRVPDDFRLNIKALEGLDQRVSHLLNLYKKIAWDDIYQRWVLPDIMRYFRLSIYVTEFRTFHRSNYIEAINVSKTEKDQFNRDLNNYYSEEKRLLAAASNGESLNPYFALTAQGPPTFSPTPSPQKGGSLILNAMTNVTPTYVLELERCEFDIESLEILPASMDIGSPEVREVNFSIKVGNFREKYINPPLNTFIYDTIVNGFSRVSSSKEELIIGSRNDRTTFVLGKESDANSFGGSALDESGVTIPPKGAGYIKPDHVSGRPFLTTGTFGSDLLNSIPSGAKNSAYKEFEDVNPTDPDTWAGNALNLGKAFVENLVEGQIDRASIQKIPGLGISLNEALNAIQSKNVLTLFGAARRAFDTAVADTLPSQELTENFVDTQFKQLLEGIVQSDATDGLTDQGEELKKAAWQILNDQGVWEEVKDLSKATDLLSEALSELNIDNRVSNPNALKNAYNTQIYEAQDVQDGLIYEGLPSSVSTSSGLSSETGIIPQPPLGTVDGNLSTEEGAIIQAPVGEATDGDTQLQPGITEGLGSTDGAIDSELDTGTASSDLGSNAGDQLPLPGDGLGESADGGLGTTEAGSELGTSPQGGGINTATPSQDLGSNAGDQLPLPGDGLGESAEGGLSTALPSEDLGENAGNPLPQPEDGLGSQADGDLRTTTPSRDLGSNAGTKLPQPEDGLGSSIDQKPINVPKPGEAVDGDKIVGRKLSSGSETSSKATEKDNNVEG